LNSYSAPWWLPGGHLQSIWPSLRPPPRVSMQRSRWTAPDGDFVDVDFGGDPMAERLLVLFHGLEGGSNSHYARALAGYAESHGWRVAIPHFRGCSGEPNRLARAYHSGDSEEIDWVLQRFNRPVFAAGVSLGGNALLKWLGERGDAARDVVQRAAAVSAPLNVAASGESLDRGLNRLFYVRHFLATLKPKSLAKLARFPGIYDAQRVRAARTFREFDNLVTAPLHGFRDTDDYWARASAKPHLARIRVPTLALNARNDPFVPAASLPQAHAVGPHVTLWQPAHGGHVGFPGGTFPGHLMTLPDAVMGWFAGIR